MKKTKMFLIIKEKSERIPNKNFQLIDGKPLHQFFVDQRENFDIFIDTDSEKIYNFYSSEGYKGFVTPYMRKQEHIDAENAGDISPAPMMIERFLNKYCDDGEIVVTSHITSPFIKDETILAALNLMSQYDSVSSVESIREFCVFGEGGSAEPINFSYDKVIKTQSLKPISILNGAFFIIKKNIFLENKLQRVSDNHFFYPVSREEAIDIDNPVDLSIAKKIQESNNEAS